MKDYTVDEPEPGIAYGYRCYQPDPNSPTGVSFAEIRGPVPFRGDWRAARRRNPTLERTVDGQRFVPHEWPSNAYLDQSQSPTLTAATFTEDYKREFLLRERWKERQDGKWWKVEAAVHRLPGVPLRPEWEWEMDKAFEIAFWRRGGVEVISA